jgi:polysaccharide biosynthesis transport protein
MNHPEMTSDPSLVQDDSIDLVAAALRFYRSALRRKWVVILCLTVAMSGGTAHYVTATRLYSSRAELIVLQAGGNVLDEERSPKSDITAQMPNFERVLQSDRVLKEAIRALPTEHRVDFLDINGDRWLDRFRSRLSVSTLRQTNVISVTFRSVDPETAYIAVDALLDSYLSFMNTMHQDTTQELVQILSEEKVRTEQELRAKEKELLDLKRNSQVLFEGAENKPKNVLTERVFALNKALTEAKERTLEARAMLISIENAVRRGENIQEFAAQINEQLGTELLRMHSGLGAQDNFTRSRIEQEMLRDQAELRSRLEMMGPNHPIVEQLRNRIMMAQAWIETRPQQASDALAKIESETLGPRLVTLARRQYDLAYNREQEFFEQYIRERDEALEVGHQLAQIQLLDNDVQNMRKYYANLLDIIKEKSLSKNRGITAKPITPPAIDRRPVTPKLSVTMLMALVAGMLSGGLGVYVLDIVDDRFHSPDDLRQTLNAPILAMIRKLPELPASHGLESLYPFAKPNSVESEAFRTLRTTIDFAPDEVKRLTISSTEPSDGKTTVMCSLGVAFAQAGKRTLLIDGDMRRPGTTRLFDLTANEGLSSVLKETRPIPEAVQGRIVNTGLNHLDVLPAGPRPVNPVELLAGERLADLIAWAETHYDQILIDAPPSLAVADVQVIGRLVDAAVLTVRPDRNRRKMVIRAAETLTSLGCRLFGIVVNHVESKHGADYAYGYGYGYGYGEGYGHEEPVHDESGRQAA